MLNYISWKGGVASDYYFWLCDKVGCGDDSDALTRYLFDVEYYWTNDLDRNRALDGLGLRKEFMDEEDVRGDWDDDNPCSVLEMLVALACRVEDSVLGDPDICLFWKMIGNLGLLETGNIDMWDRLLEGWMDRRISRNGQGGLFPLKGVVVRDQRRADIWEQCMAWLNETVVF